MARKAKIQTPKVGQANIIFVNDPDTFIASENILSSIIRLAHVDAPEVQHSKNNNTSKELDLISINQYKWGEIGKQFVKDQLVKYGAKVNVVYLNYDRYGRNICEVQLLTSDGTPLDLSLELVKNGLAAIYNTSLFSNKKAPEMTTLDIQLKAAELVAKQEQLGFWQVAINEPQNWLMPWDFRKRFL